MTFKKHYADLKLCDQIAMTSTSASQPANVPSLRRAFLCSASRFHCWASKFFCRVSNAQCAKLRLAFAGLTSIVLILSIGCSRSPYPPPGYPVGAYPQAGVPQAGYGQAATGPASVFAQQQTNPQLLDLQRRVLQLDENNRQLTTQIAQAQQQSQAFRERADLLAKQLQDATNQNKQLLATTQQYASQAQGMQASMRQIESSMTSRGGARLTANNSLVGSAANLQISGARVVPDGELIRIRIPADQVFSPGSATPTTAAPIVLDQVASALTRQFPRQRVAVEGHTDTSQIAGATSYQLSGAQAQAVMDMLVRRGGVPMQQLFVIAHGPNHPLADNNSPAGRAENRRIEVVIYPDTF